MLDAFLLWYQFKGTWSVSGAEPGILVVVDFVELVIISFEIGFRFLN